MTETAYVSTGYVQDGNSDKFYRVYAIGCWTVYQHGRTGQTGNWTGPFQHSTPQDARSAAVDQVNKKTRSTGYGNWDHDTFLCTAIFVEGENDRSKLRQLDNVRIAALGNPSPTPTPSAALATPVAPTSDQFAEFNARALRAITLAVTDPRKGAEEFALLNAEWPALEQTYSQARSYLNTLDNLVIGVTA